jgi:hypothetical protein
VISLTAAPTLAPLAFEIDWIAVLQIVIAFVLPVLVGVVTKTTTNSTLKVVLLGALALVTAFLTQWLDASIAGETFDAAQALLSGLLTWGVAIAAHLGIWKPTGVTQRAQDLGTSSDGTPSITTLDEDRVDGPDHRA